MRKIPGSFRILVALLVTLQVFALALTIWWGFLLLREHDRLPGAAAGSPPREARANASFHRMVLLEGAAFIAAMGITKAIIILILLRDRRRALALQRFFAAFAHELRAPITSVRLQADTLLASRGRPQRKELLTRLLRQTGRLDDRLAQALRIARHIEGLPVSLEKMDLGGILARFRRERKESLSGFKFETLGPANLCLWGNEEGFLMILQNLVENTRRHGGQKKPAALLTWRAEGDRVYFLFSDQGRGSGRHHAAHWPDPGESSRGAGMGLFLIRSLAQGMGGHASFDGTAPGFRVAFDLRGERSHET
ncbi:MAG: HAMP domain-containing histidine kinase [Spirochaetes bacterium]|nr:HAMP domain-containing histidine kinase [Spirochaetota bacterium]